MKAERQPFPWPLFVVVAILALITGYAIGKQTSPAQQTSAMQDMRDGELTDFAGSHAQAEDAFRRWGEKTRESPSHVREGRSPVLMAFPTKNCIQLTMDPPGVGGEPIYCYRRNSLDLLEEYSDVQ